MPISSQCPVTESLPDDRSAIRPNAAVGDGSRGLPFSATSRDMPIAASVGMCRGTCGGDVAERVAALVLIQCGIGQFADADTVEHDDDGA